MSSFLDRLNARVDSTVIKAAEDQEAREGPRCRSEHVFTDEMEVAQQAAEDSGEKVKNPRVTARLTLTDVLGPFSGEWGDRWGFKFVVEGTCNVLMWWSGKKPPMEKGQTAEVKFTVDKHEVYEGVNQTKISRLNSVKEEVEKAKKRRTKNRAEGKNDDGTSDE